MIKEDFVIQATVRRILVRSNIEYSALTFGTVNGVVYFRGLFKLAGTHSREKDDDFVGLKTQDYIKKTLYSFEKKVRLIPGVRDVLFQFINWKKETGQWVPVREKIAVPVKAKSPTKGKPESVWVVKEEDGDLGEEKGAEED